MVPGVHRSSYQSDGSGRVMLMTGFHRPDSLAPTFRLHPRRRQTRRKMARHARLLLGPSFSIPSAVHRLGRIVTIYLLRHD